jgi:hypothetical protein
MRGRQSYCFGRPFRPDARGALSRGCPLAPAVGEGVGASGGFEAGDVAAPAESTEPPPVADVSSPLPTVALSPQPSV